MSVVEMAIVRVARLDEARVRQVVERLQAQEQAAFASVLPAGAMAMPRIARRSRFEAPSTANRMAELREGQHL